MPTVMAVICGSSHMQLHHTRTSPMCEMRFLAQHDPSPTHEGARHEQLRGREDLTSVRALIPTPPQPFAARQPRYDLPFSSLSITEASLTPLTGSQ